MECKGSKVRTQKAQKSSELTNEVTMAAPGASTADFRCCAIDRYPAPHEISDAPKIDMPKASEVPLDPAVKTAAPDAANEEAAKRLGEPSFSPQGGHRPFQCLPYHA